MKKIIVTGFEPFGKEDVNPSWQAVKSARVDEKFVRKLLLQKPAKDQTTDQAHAKFLPGLCIGISGQR